MSWLFPRSDLEFSGTLHQSRCWSGPCCRRWRHSSTCPCARGPVEKERINWSTWPTNSHCLHCLPSVHTYFSKSGKTKPFASENRDSYWWDWGSGRAEWIIDDACLVPIHVSVYPLDKDDRFQQYRHIHIVFYIEFLNFGLCNSHRLQRVLRRTKYIDPPGPGRIGGY